MAKLNGCWIPNDRECEICGKGGFTIHEVQWIKVYDHPEYLACSACRKKMQDWKPLGIWNCRPDEPKPPKKKAKPKRITAIGVPDEPVIKLEPEQIIVHLEDDITLDDLFKEDASA